MADSIVIREANLSYLEFLLLSNLERRRGDLNS
jgi:hypothetical protein